MQAKYWSIRLGPRQAAEEMQRVSALNGIIQIEVPFGFPYHAAPYDFFRFTFLAFIRCSFSSCLLNDYKHRKEYFHPTLLMLSFLMELWKNKYMKYSMLVIGRLAFFWMKYIDKLRTGRSFSDFIMPKGYYMTFKKDGVKRSNHECLKDFNTLQKAK
ncbi:MAG: hypothetical protein U5K54_17660 [Cytophagales bacterium]|nr:hypothetical protein [Cytophagales bacterium]